MRADLAVGLAAAQAVHAALLFSTQHPVISGTWFVESQYLVIVTVPDEIALIGLASRALALGVPLSTWHEPDRDGEATAVALGPGAGARRVCANLPLLGRELVVA